MWNRQVLIAIVLSVMAFTFLAVDAVRTAFREPPPPNQIQVRIIPDNFGPPPPLYLPRKFKIKPLGEPASAKQAKAVKRKHQTTPSGER